MNDIYCGALFSEAYLEHFGVKGMRWGVRRYENKDGSLTEAGKRRYGKRLAKELNREDAKRVGALTRAQYSNKVSKRSSGVKRGLIVAGSLALAAVATNQLIVSQASSSSISRGRNQTIKVLNGGLKGAGKLKDLTMDDLKRLDLY